MAGKWANESRLDCAFIESAALFAPVALRRGTSALDAIPDSLERASANSVRHTRARARAHNTPKRNCTRSCAWK